MGLEYKGVSFLLFVSDFESPKDSWYSVGNSLILFFLGFLFCWVVGAINLVHA